MKLFSFPIPGTLDRQPARQGSDQMTGDFIMRRARPCDFDRVRLAPEAGGFNVDNDVQVRVSGLPTKRRVSCFLLGDDLHVAAMPSAIQILYRFDPLQTIDVFPRQPMLSGSSNHKRLVP